ncbi:hypothetical protein BD779DRAFT_1647825 [Infundibulicybe gibba]|nr:hypothetical protein BD779DRAFT_1647825 [Infundibulicybe gibba]
MTMGRTKSRKLDVPLKSSRCKFMEFGSVLTIFAELKKDPGIPRLPDIKVRKAEKHRAQQARANAKTDPDSTMASEPTLSSLVRLAADQEREQERIDPLAAISESSGKTKEQMRKHYLRTLHKVIDESDIIVLVLDARDPEGCRSRLVEEEVRRREMEGKKLVFVLNKIDLIPRENAQLWLKHLRHSTPTLPFLSSSSSQHQRTNISSKTAPALLKLLKAYKPKAGSATVGVVGYPNVGKSSLINSLKRSKVCAVAAQPGHTKNLQSIQLERGMRIVDSPGVVFDEDDYGDGKGNKKGSVLLRNVVKVEDVDDPIAVVEEILARTPSETLQKIYNLPEFGTTLDFLAMLALTSGKLLKGGTPDLNSAARHVLTDWNQQKIPYFSIPPSIHPSSMPSLVSNSAATAPTIAPGAELVGHSQILTSLSKPFELEGLFGVADAGAFGTGGDVAMSADEDGDIFWDAVEAPMDEDDHDAANTSRASLKRSRSPSMSVLEGSQQQQSQYQRQPKRQRKSKDVPEYDALPDEHVRSRMGQSNPLNRRVLKKDAKRARKAQRARGVPGTGMDVDVELDSTFMV